ncbi:hypothetical protein [Alienimonas chondri]|uniref:Uncharacterized protein n=1 Tax=Alienimonas chondri TaxID=2681879 RepID=A0ABX1VFA8_9PLAN|nr:hypothetical protein [Alienimonas chondri]NNJ26180.1 hypothetical protein [Alienimonas chondri]
MSAFIAAAALILSPAPSTGPTAEGTNSTDAIVTLAEWGFEQGEDRDFDRWPDGWLRRRGDAFPHFVPLEIDRQAFPASTGPDPAGETSGPAALWVAANGAAAAAYSPPVRLDGRPALRLSARVRCEGFDACAAVVSLSLLDVHRVRLARFLTPPVSGTSAPDGQMVEIGPAPPVPGAVWAVVGCHLVPGGNVSVGGAAWFDDLTLSAEPFLALERVGDGMAVGLDEQFSVRVIVTGVPGHATPPPLSAALRNLNDPAAPAKALSLETARNGTEVTATAEVGPLTTGLWEITATAGVGPAVPNRTLRIVAAEEADHSPGPQSRADRFGLTVATAPQSGAEELADAAVAAGAGWVRWTAGDSQADDRLSAAVRARHLRPVIRVTAATFGGDSDSATTDVLASLPDSAGTLAGVVKPLAVHVRHWQVGRDVEPASLGGPFTPSAAGLLRAAAPGVVVAGPAGSGAELRIAVGAEPGESSAWRALPDIDDPGEFLWTLVESAAAGNGPIFAGDDPRAGAALLSADGSPGQGFLPFRNASTLLGEARFLGRVQFPDLATRDQPEALVFVTPDGPVIAVRGSAPGSASLILDGVPAGRDLIGRPVPVPAVAGGASEVRWSTEPRFYSGMDERLLRLRLETEFDGGGQLQSSPEPQPLRVRVRNPDRKAAAFVVGLETPDDWTLQPDQIELTVPGGAEAVGTFTLKQPADVSLGEHPITVLLQPDGAEGVTLRIPRTATVRLAGLRLNVTDRRLPSGGWEVIQTLINELPDGSTPSFRCDVQVPGAARVSRRTDRLAAGPHRLAHRLPPEAKAGDIVWLRCTEVDGPRVLNRRWVLGQPPPPLEAP